MHKLIPHYSKIINLILNTTSKYVLFSIFFLVLYPLHTIAQDRKTNKVEYPAYYDELLINVYMQNGYSFETYMLISDSNVVYLNIESLFEQLKIKCITNASSLVGFIEKEANEYSIDFDKKEIKIGDKIIDISKSVQEEFGVNYIESSLISETFGLNLLFNQRSLSAQLTSTFELPFLKEIRIKNNRDNISKLQGKVSIADTIIPRDYHLFKLGTLDWSLNSIQAIKNTRSNAVRLSVGSELLFGAANVSINYNDQYKFDARQIQYGWRWIDNEKKIIKQAEVGNIYAQSVSLLNGPLIGATVNNSPNTVRKASGYYTINDTTEPNWTVELYINDVLVDYTLTDASGLFVFKVPIVYGYTTIRLKFYGLLGEERTEERVMNTPYTFVPAKKLEYSVTTGVLQDGHNSLFSLVNFNYGINRFLTVGGGLEYLSSIPDSPLIPFARVAFQPFSKMVLNFEYAHNVRTQSLLNFYFSKSTFLEVSYVTYAKEQLARRFNALKELKVRFSIPFKVKNITGFTKLNFNRYTYQSFTYNQFDYTLSGYYKQFSFNTSSFINWAGINKPQVNSALSLSYRHQNGIVFRPSAAYNATTNRLVTIDAAIERRYAKMYFSASYSRNIQFKNDLYFLSFKYDLPFARAGISSSYTNSSIVFSENAQGSMAFGAGNKHIHTGTNSAINKGGILFYPFLDLNQNDKLDPGEKMVLLSQVNVSGGTAEISKKDAIVRVFDLNAFVNYNVNFSDTSLDYISWRFKHNTYQVLIDPNQYKKVYVPIYSVGEVTGTIYRTLDKITEGQGRVTVQIYNSKGEKVTEILSEFDGYFTYLGLKPGKYTVRVDKEQLNKLNYNCYPLTQEITIKLSEDGDIVDGIDFEIKPIQIDKPIIQKDTIPKIALLTPKDSTRPKQIIDSSFGKISDIEGHFYTVQIGVFNKKVSKEDFKIQSSIFYEVLQSGKVRYIYGTFENKTAALSARNSLLSRGNKGVFVTEYLNGKKIKNISGILPKEKAPIENPQKPNNKTKQKSINIDSSFTNIAYIEGIVYTVQIGAYKNVVTLKQLLNLSPMYYEILDTMITRYLSGNYKTLEEAKAAKDIIKALGIEDAFVAAYKDGHKVHVKTHIKIME